MTERASNVSGDQQRGVHSPSAVTSKKGAGGVLNWAFSGLVQTAVDKLAESRLVESGVDRLAQKGHAILKKSATDATYSLQNLCDVLFAVCNRYKQKDRIPPDYYRQIKTHLERLQKDVRLYLTEVPQDPQSLPHQAPPETAEPVQQAWEKYQRELQVLQQLAKEIDDEPQEESFIKAYDVVNRWYLGQLGEMPAAFVVTSRKVLQLVQDQITGAKTAMLSVRAVEARQLEMLDEIPEPQSQVVEQAQQPQPHGTLEAFIDSIIIPNATNFAVARVVLFSICKITPPTLSSGTESEEVVEEARTAYTKKILHESSESHENFRTVVFKHIDATNIIFLRRWIAKIAYFVMYAPLNFYISHTAHNIFNFLTGKADPKNFKNILSNGIKLLNSVFFRILKAQATIESPRNDQMFGEKHPQIFRGTDVEDELTAFFETPKMSGLPRTDTTNNDFIRSFIDTFAPHFPWRARVRQTVARLQFSDSSRLSWFNTPIYCVTGPISLMAQIVIYPFEKFFDTITLWILKRQAIASQAIPKLREKLVPSLDATNSQALLGDLYAHKLNLFILERAQILLAAMKKMNGSGGVELDSDKESIPPAIRGQLKDLISNALTVLIKQDPTAKVMLGSTTTPAAVSIAISLVTESVVAQLTPLLSGLMKQGQLDEFLYTSLSKFNEAVFTPAEEVTETQKADTERDMITALKQIVQRVADYATSQKHHEAVARRRVYLFANTLQTTTFEFIQAIRLEQNAPQAPVLWHKYKKRMEEIRAQIKAHVTDGTFANFTLALEEYAAINLKVFEVVRGGDLSGIGQHLDRLQTWVDALDPIGTVQKMTAGCVAVMRSEEDLAVQSRQQTAQMIQARIAATLEKAKADKRMFSEATTKALEALRKTYEKLQKAIQEVPQLQLQQEASAENLLPACLKELEAQARLLEPVDPVEIDLAWLQYIPFIKTVIGPVVSYLSPMVTQVPDTFKKGYIANLLINSLMRWFIKGRVN